MAAKELQKMYLEGKTGRGPFFRDGEKSKPIFLVFSVDMVPPEFAF